LAHEKLQQQQVPADLQCFLQDVLASHAVATLAQLLAWLQQRPELLQLPALAAAEMACSGCHNHGALWLACNQGGPMATHHSALVADNMMHSGLCVALRPGSIADTAGHLDLVAAVTQVPSCCAAAVVLLCIIQLAAALVVMLDCVYTWCSSSPADSSDTSRTGSSSSSSNAGSSNAITSSYASSTSSNTGSSCSKAVEQVGGELIQAGDS
jgi:hypothetical protein